MKEIKNPVFAQANTAEHSCVLKRKLNETVLHLAWVTTDFLHIVPGQLCCETSELEETWIKSIAEKEEKKNQKA